MALPVRLPGHSCPEARVPEARGHLPSPFRGAGHRGGREGYNQQTHLLRGSGLRSGAPTQKGLQPTGCIAMRGPDNTITTDQQSPFRSQICSAILTDNTLSAWNPGMPTAQKVHIRLSIDLSRSHSRTAPKLSPIPYSCEDSSAGMPVPHWQSCRVRVRDTHRWGERMTCNRHGQQQHRSFMRQWRRRPVTSAFALGMGGRWVVHFARDCAALCSAL